MRLPTVRLRHKKKGIVITVNEHEWARDLGRYKWSAFERVGERHNNASQPIEIASSKPASVPPADVDESLPEVAEESTPPRRRGRPRKNSV